jgi:FKBP-type peptidyl-prolyl cis-trans isomerase 2
MNKGDWVKIEFTGRIKASGEIFDLTSAAEAKKHGLFDEKKEYGPMLIIAGAGAMMPGVEKHLLSMKVGEKKTFDVSPMEGAGIRKPELTKIVPLSKFLEKNINPFPGLWLNVDNRNCRIMSVAAGRVRVDFNHPLAGKELTYEIEVKEEITDKKERIKVLLAHYGLKGRVDAEGKSNVITLDSGNPFMKRIIEETLKKWGDTGPVEIKEKLKVEEMPVEKKEVHTEKHAAEEKAHSHEAHEKKAAEDAPEEKA